MKLTEIILHYICIGTSRMYEIRSQKSVEYTYVTEKQNEEEKEKEREGGRGRREERGEEENRWNKKDTIFCSDCENNSTIILSLIDVMFNDTILLLDIVIDLNLERHCSRIIKYT